MRKIVVCLFLLLAQVTVLHAEERLTPQLLATKFNLRTIYSSFGPGMDTYCGSYPIDFFSAGSIQYEKNQVLFETDIDFFILKVVGNDEIKVIDQIKSPGNYYSNTNYKVVFDKKNGDIRAKETFTPVPSPCVPYPKEH